MYFTLDSVIYELERVGFQDVVLPFLLVFALVYAILLEVGPFKNKEKLGGVIALVIAAYSVFWAPFAGFVRGMVGGFLAIILIVFFGVIIVSTVFIRSRPTDDRMSWYEKLQNTYGPWVALLAIIAFLYMAEDRLVETGLIEYGALHWIHDALPGLMALILVAAFVKYMITGSLGGSNLDSYYREVRERVRRRMGYDPLLRTFDEVTLDRMVLQEIANDANAGNVRARRYLLKRGFRPDAYGKFNVP